MLENAPNSELLKLWREGHQPAATVLFRRYLTRLSAYARSHLSKRLARRCDEEDVVMSAWRSFFVAAERQDLTVAGENLWPLLATITLRKITAAAERHGAQMRSVAREVGQDDSHGMDWIADDPSPDQAALVADEVVWLLAQLNPQDRDIVSSTLQGESTDSIATRLNCSTRTVRRTLAQARSLLAGHHPDLRPESPQAPARDDEKRALTTDPQQAPPPLNLSEYRLQEFVGEGSVGKVYRSLWLPGNVTVAVKFLRKSLWRDERARASFFNEVRLSAAFRHSHVAACHGWGKAQHGAVFLVSDWIDGRPIDQWWQRVGLPPLEWLRKLLPILDALQHMHETGVIHCDLSPRNILIDAQDKPWLVDLGMARVAGLTEASGGTPGYLAPEQVSNAFGDIGPQTDVYGIGALAFSLLTGRPPHVGRDVSEMLSQVISSREVIVNLPSSIPDDLRNLLATCLKKNPDERCAGIGEVRDRVNSLLRVAVKLDA